jgi:hypothetical protein
MPDEPLPLTDTSERANRFDLEPTRVKRASGGRWLVVWILAACLVVAFALAGNVLTLHGNVPTTDADAALTTPAPAPTTSLPPLIIESTDFHANSGPAYYGIGGRLVRALETTNPSPSPSPTAP